MQHRCAIACRVRLVDQGELGLELALELALELGELALEMTGRG